ncbi:TPA: hypothetical protein ACNTSV_004620, partial [Escherichia coli]
AFILKYLQAFGHKMTDDIANGIDVHITTNIINTGCIRAIKVALLKKSWLKNVKRRHNKINLKKILLSILFS